ncbi:hypothetical protein TSAR_015365 [Trichomalopsis sarcophagae]|uniref:Uncharacterized protein n=1 Tax=Trichomalopsis sarcophagae TaxID=543379 RepID=A0A232ESC4_9HYME|nr:hypothetical protein TSAR_015365 [Trichomalopsis sarcophagae]
MVPAREVPYSHGACVSHQNVVNMHLDWICSLLVQCEIVYSGIRTTGTLTLEDTYVHNIQKYVNIEVS